MLCSSLKTKLLLTYMIYLKQVESLMSEIENLAALQGEEEARRHQSLLDQIEILQGQLMKTKKLDSLSGNTEYIFICT